uniref:PH domain-containing protein n=1 Tax=Panagrellus redivivus TaxID=6233 RepID=A0A7E4UXB1_PANRE
MASEEPIQSLAPGPDVPCLSGCLAKTALAHPIRRRPCPKRPSASMPAEMPFDLSVALRVMVAFSLLFVCPYRFKMRIVWTFGLPRRSPSHPQMATMPVVIPTPEKRDGNMDAEELRRQQFAMRSFTESIEMDLPPAPELPATLDIDRYDFDAPSTSAGNSRLTSSSTTDTIVEVRREPISGIDAVTGETLKYPMTVPEPGHTEVEIELHRSLVKATDSGEDSDNEVAGVNGDPMTSSMISTSPIRAHDDDHAALRREYSNTVKQRPRPTTPTSKCTLEQYAAEQEAAAVAESEKMRVKIPRKSIKKSPEDFYASMANQMPVQSRHKGGFVDPDEDIIEQNPDYKSNAPVAPVVHRRTSIEWEAFGDSVDSRPQMASNGSKPGTPPGSPTADEPTTATATASDTDKFTSAAEKLKDFDDSFNPEPDSSSTEPATAGKKPETAEAFAEELFGGGTNVDWDTAAASATSLTLEDDPAFQVDASEVPDSEYAQHTPAEPVASETEPTKSESPSKIPDIGAAFEDVPAALGTPTINIIPDHNNYDVDEDEHEHVESAQPEPPKQEEATTTVETTANVEPIASGEAEPTAAAATDTQQYDYDYNSAAYAGYDQNYYGTDPNAYNYDYSQTQTTAEGTDPAAAGTDYSQYGATDPNAPGYATDPNAAAYAADPNAAGYDYSNYDYSSYYPTNADGTVDYSAYYAAQAANGAADPNQTYDYSQTAGTEATAGYDQTAYATNADGTYAYGADAAAGYAAPAGDATAAADPNAAYYAAYGTDPNAYDANAYAAYYGTEVAGATAATGGTDAYGYDVSQYGTGYSYGDTATDYSQYGSYVAPTEAPAAEGSETQAEPAPEAPPAPTQLSQPALPPMRARTPDPFSWEVQETNIEHHGSALPPPRPPPAVVSSPEPEAVHEEQKDVGSEPSASAPPRPPAPGPARPPPPAAKAAPPPPLPPQPKKPAPPTPTKQESEEEDAWAKFKKMTESVNTAVKSTEEKLKDLSGASAADDIKDESYLATIGGGQGMVNPEIQKQIHKMEEEKKKAKADKKKAKKLRKSPSPELDPQKEMDLDKAAEALAAKIASMRAHELEGYVPGGVATPAPPPPPAAPVQPVVKQVESPKTPDTPKPTKEAIPESTSPEVEEAEKEPVVAPAEHTTNWAAFDDSSSTFEANLPPSESDFFTTHLKEVPPADADDPFAPPKPIDPFEATNGGDTYDPFDIRPAEDIVAQAKERATLIAARADDEADFDYLQRPTSALSSPTPEGGSPASSRPCGFEDEFKPSSADSPTPLYDEDDSEALTEFPKKFTGDGWELMIRYPPKKKIMADRYWKPCYVKIIGNMLYVFNSKAEQKPLQEIMLQPTYSLSDNTLQAYDIYGKIHTVKLQCVSYKERIGIRAGQISRLVEGHVTKYGLPLEHAAQVNVLAKFGSLNADDINSFINVIEDFLFTATIKREVAPAYKQDEVQIHCYDEYNAYVDKDGFVSQQQARVRMFCLAFVTGSPFLEIGLNDRRRQGKEIVRRKDILPMYTERWIRFENLDFHCTVDKPVFEEEQVIKLSPPDGIFFEICRFRVRPPKNREKPLTVRNFMRIAGSKIEIRIDVMAAAQTQRAKGTVESTRNIPCEDICIRFPIPEAWIYIFREEKHFGVGSVHSKTRRTGKVKNLKDRLMGTVATTEQSLIETAIGEAKYEHVYRSLVWRIPRLPEKHHAAYKEHVLKCRFDLSNFDLMPETFLPTAEVEFTMPLATISNTVVRSVSVEQHEDSDRVEKFVRYVAKCKYQVEVDYVQCNSLDNDAIFDPTVANPEAVMSQPKPAHEALFNPDEVQKQHGGYGIEFSPSETGARPRNDSSSDDEPEKRPVPVIEINMKGYGY